MGLSAEPRQRSPLLSGEELRAREEIAQRLAAGKPLPVELQSFVERVLDAISSAPTAEAHLGVYTVEELDALLAMLE